MIVWGPLSYLSAFAILVSSSYRYPLQAIVSLGHLYGDVLYISTSLVDLYMRGVSYSRPEAYYFWFYFLFLNLIWIFVPAGESHTTCLVMAIILIVAVLLYQSTITTATAFSASQQIPEIHSNEEASRNVQRVTKNSTKGL